MPRRIEAGYRQDLAAIHDAGYTSVGAEAGQLLATQLKAKGFAGGRVIDLGCGSGAASEVLLSEGFEVVGYDLSPAMIELARRRAPRASFHVGPILDAKIPNCVGVVAAGEIVNYLFDPRTGASRLASLFQRIGKSLAPRGVFLFDSAGPGRAPGGAYQGFREGSNWLCFHQSTEDRPRRLLVRRIITFMKSEGGYRRTDETHHLRLYPPAEVAGLLRTAGFRARRLESYGGTKLPAGMTVFLAQRRR